MTRAIPAPRKSRAELADERARQASFYAMVRERMPDAPIPHPPTISQFRNHFAGLGYDDQRRLWVRTLRGEPTSTVFDLFNQNGGYLGEVRLSVRVGAFVLAADRLVATVTSPEGIPFVHIWRVH